MLVVLPGFYTLHNRFPHSFEFQCDMRPYVIPAHSDAVVTLSMAQAALKQSAYFTTAEGFVYYGCYVKEFVDPNEDLTDLTDDYKEQVQFGNIEIVEEITLNGHKLGEPTMVKLNLDPGTMPKRRARVDPNNSVTVASNMPVQNIG